MVLVVPFVAALLVQKTYTVFIAFVEFVPPIVWLTFGTLAVSLSLISAAAWLLFGRKTRSGTVEADPASPYESASVYEPPAMLSRDSSYQTLVLCSPVSGTGEGVEVYEKVVKPMLRKARIRFEVVFLESGAQAFNVAADLDVAAYSALIVIGGDKTVHEVIQGLAVNAADRTELRSAARGGRATSNKLCTEMEGSLVRLFKRLPLAVVPCGDRNGLATSLGLSDPFVATKAAVERIVIHEGKGRPVDLYKVARTDIETDRSISAPVFPLYDAHLTTWGVLADVGLIVERGPQWIPRSWRWFSAAALALFRIRRPRGRLFLTVQPSIDSELVGTSLPQPESKEISLAGEFTLVSVSNVSRMSRAFVLAPGARPDDGRLHVAVIRHCSRWHALRTLLAAAAGEEIGKFPWVQSFVCSKIGIANETGEVDICGFGEDEIWGRKGPGVGLTIESLQGVAQFLY